MRTALTISLALGIIGIIAWARPASVVSGLAQEQLWAKKTTWENQCDIVFAGDSRVYRSLSPAIFRRIIKDSHPCNFGFSGNGYGDEYLARINSLWLPKGDGTPRHILVLGITPASLTQFAVQDNDYLSYAHRSLMERYMLGWFGGFLKPFGPLVKEKTYHQHFYEDGWVASFPKIEEPEKGLRMYRKLWDKVHVSSEASRQVLRSVRSWQSSGVEVYGFEPPTSQSMRELEQSRSGFDVDSFKRAFQIAGGHWINVPLKYHSYDGSHLTAAAALKLSSDLAHTIKNQSGL